MSLVAQMIVAESNQAHPPAPRPRWSGDLQQPGLPLNKNKIKISVASAFLLRSQQRAVRVR